MGVDIDEISDFLDLWCDRCNDCNSVGRYAMTRHGETSLQRSPATACDQLAPGDGCELSHAVVVCFHLL